MDLYTLAYAGSAVSVISLVYVLLKMRSMDSEDDGWWTRSILEDRRVKVRTEWSLCMGSGSCAELAPGIFRLDWTKKKSVFDPAPLEMLEDRGTAPGDIFRAAQSCPYRAIILEDADSGEKLFPIQ